jgi:hydrogenase maturation factor
MTLESAAEQCHAVDGHCITCSDEGIVMRVMSADGSEATCLDDAGEAHRVATDLVGSVDAGDELLVHAGVAIRHLRLGDGALEARSGAR